MQSGRSSLHIGFSLGDLFGFIATFIPLMCNEERPDCGKAAAVKPHGNERRRSATRAFRARYKQRAAAHIATAARILRKL